MKNFNLGLRDKLVAKYLEKNQRKKISKKTDINVLLNQVKVNQKNESRKKIFFSAAASTSLLLFGLLIFS
tara:strand:- start:220 stop:429 length:210 start_codon:yes stop_codon:yes gene_type:complete